MIAVLRQRLPQLVTAGIFLLLFATAGWRYRGENFASAPNIANLFISNGSLGIIAVGMTLVIFSGGIDLSVGAVAGFTNILVAVLVEQHGVNPWAAMLLGLCLGTLFGAAMGAVIQVFKQPAFLVTLAGMFFARGCAFWISTESIDFKNATMVRLADYTVRVGGSTVHPLPAYVLLAVFALGYVLAQHTRFGRNLLAIGGNEQSALLMGLPVGATKIAVYALCGAGAALAGLVSTVITGGDSTYGNGLELDAIATVVIGGTLLTGGRGHIFGTLCGLLIVGTIQSAISFDGTLSSWWTRIVTGALLLAFILFQRLLLRLTQQ